MIRVIIAEDQSIIREGLKMIIETDPDIEVIGYAENGRQACELCGQLSPDLILMDLMMPVCDGIEGTRLIKERFESIKVLILTTFNEEDKVSLAFESGADGYVFKGMEKEGLLLAVKGVVKDLRVIHKDAYQMLIRQLQLGSIAHMKKPVNSNLSERELDIIRLIVDGKDNAEIAATLCLSGGTIRNVISRILKKLGFKDRVQLAVFAVKNEIV